MADRPFVETYITQHTLWQALTGTPPPPPLAPRPISRAALDSRDVRPGSLFVALRGSRTDGHLYLPEAMAGGADALICEERGLASLTETNALIIDCRIQDRAESRECGAGLGLPESHASPFASRLPDPDVSGPGRPIAYVVHDAGAALQATGIFQRLHRTSPSLKVVGVTGSVGKTSTKELAASVLAQRYRTHRSRGNLNSEQGLPLALLGLHTGHERAVLELGMYDLGEIRSLCTLARPEIGLVTNVGPSHLERLGTLDRIAQAKAELIEALPAAGNGGVAVLNFDDDRVRAMASRTDASPFFFGLSSDADLWADELESLGMEGIRFRLHHRQQDNRIRTQKLTAPLLGRHSIFTALGAAAVGIVNGLSWQEIRAGLQQPPDQLRLVVTPGVNGSTVIDDTYNASPSSALAALNLLDDLRKNTPKTAGARRGLRGAVCRRIAVLGDMRELGSFTTEGHKQVGAFAAGVTDLLVTVGDLGCIVANEARKSGLACAAVYETGRFEEAVHLLKEVTRPGDLLLIKGSRAVGMDRIVAELTPSAQAKKADRAPERTEVAATESEA